MHVACLYTYNYKSITLIPRRYFPFINVQNICENSLKNFNLRTWFNFANFLVYSIAQASEWLLVKFPSNSSSAFSPQSKLELLTAFSSSANFCLSLSIFSFLTNGRPQYSGERSSTDAYILVCCLRCIKVCLSLLVGGLLCGEFSLFVNEASFSMAHGFFAFEPFAFSSFEVVGDLTIGSMVLWTDGCFCTGLRSSLGDCSCDSSGIAFFGSKGSLVGASLSASLASCSFFAFKSSILWRNGKFGFIGFCASNGGCCCSGACTCVSIRFRRSSRSSFSFNNLNLASRGKPAPKGDTGGSWTLDADASWVSSIFCCLFSVDTFGVNGCSSKLSSGFVFRLLFLSAFFRPFTSLFSLSTILLPVLLSDESWPGDVGCLDTLATFCASIKRFLPRFCRISWASG